MTLRIVSGEAWLFLSPGLLLYAAGLAVAFHLLIVGYEEPRLRARFGEPYRAYSREVARWLPRPAPADETARPQRRSRHEPEHHGRVSDLRRDR